MKTKLQQRLAKEQAFKTLKEGSIVIYQNKECIFSHYIPRPVGGTVFFHFNNDKTRFARAPLSLCEIKENE